jgi:uncharacterized protein with von Willebrand factor type A (vWA) domain
VFDNWSDLKAFKADSATNETKEHEAEETPAEENAEHNTASVKKTEPESKIDESLDEAMEAAFEDVSEEKETKFKNFLDNGVQTDAEREEMWKHPWIRRIATQLSEMEKDHSQFERALQHSKDRRDQALQKSLHVLNGKIKTIAEKVKANV